METERCDNCGYSEQYDGEDFGCDNPVECHRYPPIVSVKMEYAEDMEDTVIQKQHWNFPILRPHRWCGEWTPKGSDAVRSCYTCKWVKNMYGGYPPCDHCYQLSNWEAIEQIVKDDE